MEPKNSQTIDLKFALYTFAKIFQLLHEDQRLIANHLTDDEDVSKHFESTSIFLDEVAQIFKTSELVMIGETDEQSNTGRAIDERSRAETAE